MGEIVHWVRLHQGSQRGPVSNQYGTNRRDAGPAPGTGVIPRLNRFALQLRGRGRLNTPRNPQSEFRNPQCPESLRASGTRETDGPRRSCERGYKEEANLRQSRIGNRKSKMPGNRQSEFRNPQCPESFRACARGETDGPRRACERGANNANHYAAKVGALQSPRKLPFLPA